MNISRYGTIIRECLTSVLTAFLNFQIGTLNGLFVLGRSIGFIGHHLDQKRLRAPLYRHPADDIFINMADVQQPRVLGKMA